jgi:hypothetical protein
MVSGQDPLGRVAKPSDPRRYVVHQPNPLLGSLCRGEFGLEPCQGRRSGISVTRRAASVAIIRRKENGTEKDYPQAAHRRTVIAVAHPISIEAQADQRTDQRAKDWQRIG